MRWQNSLRATLVQGLLLLSTPLIGYSQAKLMSPKDEQAIKDLLPEVANKQLQQVLQDSTTIFYTKNEMPKAYQFVEPAGTGVISNGIPGLSRSGVHSPLYNISADADERIKPHGAGGNGNVEFPWNVAGGTDKCTTVSTFHFIWFPKQANGKPYPMVLFSRHNSGLESHGHHWIYPVGTLVGEILMQRSPEGYYFPFEVRTRTRRADGWGIEILRPFPTAARFVAAVKKLRPNWKSQPALLAAVRQLDSDEPLPKYQLIDERHPNQVAFASDKLGVDVLPDLKDNDLIARLLTEFPFREAAGEHWRADRNGIQVLAPTTEAAWHIVPAHYHGNFAGNDSAACMRCHESTNMHVNRFDSRRGWYGRVRGSDGIFSFHPFALSSISYNGFDSPPSIRQELVQAGVVAHFDESKHGDAKVYVQLPKLK